MPRKKSSKAKTVSKKEASSSQRAAATKASSKKAGRKQRGSFPVVGVGGSAGGLEAFSELLRGLPADTGMAFIYIQHVDPNHKSILGDLLSRATRMPVQTVTNRTTIKKNHVYVIAPDSEITLSNEHLTVHRRTAVSPFRPIDRFFASLAERRKGGAIGVILSGTATDGVRGLREIKSEGGFTFAQDPRTAKFDGMPRHAIATQCVDRILPPDQIGKELAVIRKHPYVDGGTTTEGDAQLVHGDGLKQLFGLLRRSTGIDFTGYKPATLKRRIARRMVLLKKETLDGYLLDLRRDSEEQFALQEDMLIRVTSFFREPEVSEALRKKVFPKLLESNPEKKLRIWVPACATGQEVYSLAMVLVEYLAGNDGEGGIQIFGTDVSNSAIEFARAGSYPDSIINEVAPERLRRFFTKVDDGYQISKRLREMCLFARHDVTRDPPFSKIDLISCRNLLIYLESASQKRLAAMFHYALKPNGYLVLGRSESFSAQALFAVEDSKNKILRPKPVTTPRIFEFAAADPPETASPEAPPAKNRVEAHIRADAESFIWEHYAAAGMIVDDDLQVHHVRGDTGLYVAMSPGEASLHLPRLLRPELALKARTLIQKVKKTKKPAQQENLQIKTDSGFRTIHMKVIPRPDRDGLQTFLVFFEDARQDGKRRKEAPPVALASVRKVGDLQKELASTQQYLQSVIEDQEAANEELQAANEEVRSANEELQSTNEELETAKEELQSSNEELTTLNEELRERNTQLRLVNDDLENLLLGINIPVVIIGSDHRIRRFTLPAEKLLNLLPGDVGRPIENVKGEVEIPELKKMINRVVERIEFVERDVRDSEGHWYCLQMRPFKTSQNKIDGLLMSLVNIDREKAAEEKSDVSEVALLTSRQWSTGLLSLQEDERRRLARELHDNINQELAVAMIQLERLEEEDQKSRKKVVEQVRRRLDDLTEQIRLLSHQLHPTTLEHLGLATALNALCEEFGEKSTVELRWKQSKVPKEIPATISLNLYRVAQEAVKNAVEHARASGVSVQLVGLKGRLRLMIEDDGCGFHPEKDVPRGGLGLLSMRERLRVLGGELTVKSEPNQGTKIKAEVPLSSRRKSSAVN